MKDKKQIEYNRFLTSKEIPLPIDVEAQSLNHVKEKLDPSFLMLFMKLGLIQTFLGALTMLICPQYGIAFSEYDIMYDFFQTYLGPYGCMIGCGVTFTSIAALTSSLTLTKAEIKKIFNYQWFIFPITAIFFMTIFTTLVQEFYLNVSMLWLTGALIGYLISFDLGYFARVRKNLILGLMK